ncbi:DUF5703 domain-containing protein [Maribellus mangrovi]|uniref:DUF5703 domain-containing protein n=1 Tax=Maribellus mangrovi TaxID=3133146 RepID=UPI0030EDA864
MKNFLYILFLIIPAFSTGQTLLPENYNVVWNSQSVNSSESMPCGGGDIGLNVWVENGDLLFYMAQSGTFDENNTMPKLGRVRIQCDPNPFDGAIFRQELQLERGNVLITAEKDGVETKFEIWVDVFDPGIHVEAESDEAIGFQASYESWRYMDHELRKFESFQNSYKWAPLVGLKTKKDEVDFEGNAVLFYHRNRGETVFDVTVNQQQLDAVKDSLFNPLENLTFGGFMWGENLIKGGTSDGKYLQTEYKSWSLKSKEAAKKHHLKIVLNTGQFDTVDGWKAALESRIEKENKQKDARKLTLDWWQNYWQRSFVFVQPENEDRSKSEWQVGRNYQLFRYMLGCNAYGKYPTKFNGGLFTVDPIFTNEERPFTPDFRNWGGGTFTAQNQRLVYFPMLASGDFDMMKPQLEFYLRLLNNAELRSKYYWDHEGACFTEQIENFGLPNPSEYGWKRPENYDPGMMYNAWLEYQWDTALEICWMALQLHQYNGMDITEYIPLIESCLTFFDEHYQYLARQRGIKALDENGDLVLYPGSACETYKMATNATSTIVALKKVAEGLIEIEDQYPEKIDTTKWEAFLERIPPISFREMNGKKMIAPAKLWERINNTEAPQLYPVYPWGIYGVGKPGLDMARNTYLYDPDVIKFQDHQSWKQYNIFAARLGLKDEAVKYTLLKLQDSGRRFPAFWGPGFDWVPDHNWGGSGMIGVQEMLLQTNADKIYLFPAWPPGWDVHFKLYAPGNTTVEAELKNGEVRIIDVQPETRKTDIEILLKQN